MFDRSSLRTKTRVFWLAAAASLIATPMVAVAHGPKGHENLQVIEHADHKTLDAGMKELTKALGAKCSTCHVKGDYASDALQAKLEARALIETALATDDQTKRSAALEDLLKAMDKTAQKNEANVWKAIDRFNHKHRDVEASNADVCVPAMLRFITVEVVPDPTIRTCSLA